MEESHLAAHPVPPRRWMVVGAAYGVRRTPSRPVRTDRATAVTWMGLALAFCAWEVVAYAWGNDAGHPTLSLFADPVLDTYPGRLAGYGAWLATGVWLVTR